MKKFFIIACLWFSTHANAQSQNNIIALQQATIESLKAEIKRLSSRLNTVEEKTDKCAKQDELVRDFVTKTAAASLYAPVSHTHDSLVGNGGYLYFNAGEGGTPHLVTSDAQYVFGADGNFQIYRGPGWPKYQTGPQPR